MQKRISNKVSIEVVNNTRENSEVSLNLPLFEWVIENLCKNAIDAMDGVGKITITMSELPKQYAIDLHDTGKGMTKAMYQMVFHPGFTTKKRGWGLGLSLDKKNCGRIPRRSYLCKTIGSGQRHHISHSASQIQLNYQYNACNRFH